MAVRNGNLHVVLVTFRRGEGLVCSLNRVLQQTLRPESVHVIDNDPTESNRRTVEDLTRRSGSVRIHYHPSEENLGPAGGWARGMECVLASTQPEDWIVTLDDNNPPETDDEFEKVFHLAKERQRHEHPIAGIGIIGARFDWKRGLIQRLPDSELSGAVPVDYLGGGFLPMYSVQAIRDVGTPNPELFFGFVELEYGLRFRRAGYGLLAHGDLWRSRRELWGRTNVTVRARRTCKIHWQKYYRIRNYITMMLDFGRPDLAFRWAAIQCIGKPLCSCICSPRLGYRGFRQAWSASRDGFRHRLGRTVEPPPGPPSRD